MISADALWPALLQARDYLLEYRARKSGARSWEFLCAPGGEWQFEASSRAVAWSINDHRLTCDLESPRPREWSAALGIVTRYLDILLSQATADSSGTQVRTLASFAQSLDGFIATMSGDSQWIGNEANLVHAHRLRALHDAILVGRNTLVVDKPRLSVRKVAGKNPTRVVVTKYAGLDDAFLDALHAPTLVLAPKNGTDDTETVTGEHAGVTMCPVDDTLECGHLSPKAMLDQLRELDVRSLMIEGGGKTASLFLRHGVLDEADIHIAPIWLGDGIRPFQVPAQGSVAATTCYAASTFDLDGQALMTLRLH
ncbi:MAG: dihydrofolate reductase family protein [Pseudomonadota bacterium]